MHKRTRAQDSSVRRAASAIMVENHSNSNLEPFLLMAKSMKGGAAVKVIDDAIGAVSGLG